MSFDANRMAGMNTVKPSNNSTGKIRSFLAVSANSISSEKSNTKTILLRGVFKRTSWDINQGKEPETEPRNPEPHMSCYVPEPEPIDRHGVTAPLSPLPDMQSPTRGIRSYSARMITHTVYDAPQNLERAPGEEDTQPPDWNTVEASQTRLQDLGFGLPQSRRAKYQDPNHESTRYI
ncbi:hypothetical protein N7463_006717 [Penicillium fimorum]|uniref:Uncharacterized protein n=1 Tax=Penicillium fimorum TaxID=1882269 RepID=A0A9W9XUZ3_9EURO|nr:hypothetical protein N7463_006717 [Penicillium fimorum]